MVDLRLKLTIIVIDVTLSEEPLQPDHRGSRTGEVLVNVAHRLRLLLRRVNVQQPL